MKTREQRQKGESERYKRGERERERERAASQNENPTFNADSYISPSEIQTRPILCSLIQNPKRERVVSSSQSQALRQTKERKLRKKQQQCL